MAGEKVRVGVVGVGGMGSAHCYTCPKIEEVQLAAVADIDAARAREIGEQFKVPFFSRHEDLIASKLVDGVIVATPHYFHPPIAIDAFKARLHVLSEKPIAVGVDMAEKMIKAAQKSGKVFAVMFQLRSSSVYQKARELVESGALGEVRRTLLVSPEFRSQAYYDSGGWRATWAGEGGGVMMNQAPHIMDIFTLLGGLPSRVTGRIRTLMHRIEVEDDAVALLEYPNGALGYFYVSTCEAGPGQLIEIVGDKGKLRIQDGELSFYQYSPSVSEFNRTNTEMWGSPRREKVELDIPKAGGGHQAIIRNWARAILYGEKLLSPGAEGIRSLELSNAITLSSFKNKPVTIPIRRRAFAKLLEQLKATSTFQKQVEGTKRETDPQFKKG